MINSMNFWIWGIVALDLAVAIAAMCALRFGSGLLFEVDTRDELAKKDNFAFGIVLGGGTLAVALILAAAASGNPALTFLTELKVVVIYAVVGLLLLKVGIVINDLVVFHKFSVKEQIQSGNCAAGVVQAANLVALSILIHGAMNWTDGGLVQSLASLVIVFLLSQLVVLAVTRTRSIIYAKRHDGEAWQKAIEGGNTALAVRYAGHLLGAALASSSAGGMVGFITGADATAWMAYAAWLVWAIILAIVLLALSMLAQWAFLAGIDVVEEVDNQQNIGIATIEATVFVGVGLIIRAIAG